MIEGTNYAVFKKHGSEYVRVSEWYPKLSSALRDWERRGKTGHVQDSNGVRKTK